MLEDESQMSLALALKKNKLKPVESTTLFFREISAIETIVSRLYPMIGADVKIASVGCSSGEEVYSLLLFVEERGNGITVDGYDYQESQLLDAQRAEYTYIPCVAYSGTEYADIDTAARHNMTEIEVSDDENVYRISEKIRAKARFNFHDIASSPLPRKYPIIMCANVLYHYGRNDRPSIEDVLTNLAASLQPRGFLVLEYAQYKGENANDYFKKLENHPLFTVRNDLAIPATNRLSGQTDFARVLQLK